MVALSPLGGAGWQFFDNNGIPLAGGKLYTYAAGTTTPAVTYTTNTGAPGTENSNPIILDSAGRVPSEIWLVSAAAYKFRMDTATGVTLWTKDNVPGIYADATVAASDVAYNQGSTGAVDRTVQSRLQDYVSVKDFGAVGDGVTDDTAALNNAAAYVRSVNGALTINPTTSFYLVSDTIDLTGIRVIDGRAAQIKGDLGAKPMVLIGANTGVLTEASIWIEVFNTPSSSSTSGNIGIKCLGLRSSSVTYFARGFNVGLYFDGASGVARNWLDNKFYVTRSFNNGTHVHIDLSGTNYFISNRFNGGSYYLGSGVKVAGRGTFKVTLANTGLCSQNVVDQPEIGLDGNSQHASHALFTYIENSATSGNNGIEFLNARVEGYGVFATDPYFVNVATHTGGTNTRFATNIQLIGNTFGRFLIETGDLNYNSVMLTNLDQFSIGNNQAQQRISINKPEFYQTSAGVYVTERVVYDNDFTAPKTVITTGVSSRLTRALGDGQLITGSSVVGYGLRYNKVTGSSAFLSLPQAARIAIVCYDATGAVLSGVAPYYARGCNSRSFTIAGRALYQMVSNWVWLHPDVASFELISTSWTSATVRLIDVQNFYVTYGEDLTPVYTNMTNPNFVSSTASIQSYYNVGMAFDGTATNGWRNTFYLKTTTSTGASSGATAIDATSVVGVTGGDVIGIELDTVMTGTERQYFHTTVSSVVGSTINLGGALPADVAAGRTILINRWAAR